MSIEIKEVLNNGDLKTFLALPDEIYSDEPKYVKPLNLHMKMMIGKLGRPEKHLLLAFENGKPVARIGFKTHNLNGEKFLHFGFFECTEGYKEAAKALFEWGRAAYPELPVRGPYQFRMEDPYVGALVDGFDEEPYFLMSYGKPYYDEYLKYMGLESCMDLYTYELQSDLPLDKIKPHADKAISNNVTIRTLDKTNLKREATAIAKIFNEALAQNWGFEEFDKAMIDEMVQLLRFFIDERVVAFAMKDGKEVGCLIMIPNYNPLIKNSKGKLGPSLLMKYFKRQSIVTGIRGYALGVLSDYHGMGIGSYLTVKMSELGRAAGYETAEISWVLADNGPMNELSKAMGGKPNKIYRIYETPN